MACQGADFGSAQEELEAVLAMRLGQRGGAGLPHDDLGRQALAEAAGEGLESELGLDLMLAAAGDEQHVGEWRGCGG